MAQSNRPGAVRKNKKGAVVGSGGQRRKALKGRGPTPKAEDRVYHKAYKAKQAAARKQQTSHNRPTRAGKGPIKEDLVTGRNSVLEALRSNVPAKTLFVATKIEVDDRVKDILQMCAERNVPTLGKPPARSWTDSPRTLFTRAWRCRFRPTTTATRTSTRPQ